MHQGVVRNAARRGPLTRAWLRVSEARVSSKFLRADFRLSAARIPTMSSSGFGLAPYRDASSAVAQGS